MRNYRPSSPSLLAKSRFLLAVSARPISAMSNMSGNQRYENDLVSQFVRWEDIDRGICSSGISLNRTRKRREWLNGTSNSCTICKHSTTASVSNCTEETLCWETSRSFWTIISHLNVWGLQFIVATVGIFSSLPSHCRTTATFETGVGPKGRDRHPFVSAVRQSIIVDEWPSTSTERSLYSAMVDMEEWGRSNVKTCRPTEEPSSFLDHVSATSFNPVEFNSNVEYSQRSRCDTINNSCKYLFISLQRSPFLSIVCRMI